MACGHLAVRCSDQQVHLACSAEKETVPSNTHEFALVLVGEAPSSEVEPVPSELSLRKWRDFYLLCFSQSMKLLVIVTV